MKKTIACVGTLDTKGIDIEYIKNILKKKGHNTLVIDTGIMGEPHTPPDITRQEVLRAAGKTMEEIIGIGDQGKCAKIMADGLTNLMMDLLSAGKIHGVVSIGGGMGASISTTAMKALPVGLPKVMVAHKVGQAGGHLYVGTKDVTLMPSICDPQGLNKVSTKIFANAAGAVAGMVEVAEIQEAMNFANRPMIVMSENGTTYQCASKVAENLEEAGYEVVIFGGAGIGGRCQEECVRDNPVIGVIELDIYEIMGEILNAAAASGPDRMETAGKKGIAQIVTPGSADFVAFLGPETVPSRYRTGNRKFVAHNPQATLMRVTAEEFKIGGKVIADKLNKAKGPVRVLIPTRGFSSLDQEGQPFYDPETDKILIDTLKDHLKPSIPFREVDVHINDPMFAKEVFQEFLKLV